MSGPVLPSFNERRAMPAPAFLDQTLGFDLDAQMAATDQGVRAEELKAQREQVVKLAARLLEPDQLPLLEWLLDITLRRPVFLPNMGSQAVAYCALREGQNQVAWQILQAIAEGRQEALVNREGQ